MALFEEDKLVIDFTSCHTKVARAYNTKANQKLEGKLDQLSPPWGRDLEEETMTEKKQENVLLGPSTYDTLLFIFDEISPKLVKF